MYLIFKGHVEINYFNIGRYWPVRGPQQTLYVPSAILKTGQNVITVTELEKTPCDSTHQCYVQFVDVPELNSTTSGGTPLFATHHG